jgi:hypothetical protein
MKIDFFARRTHFIDHLLPIWRALSDEIRGTFYVSAYLKEYAEREGFEAGLVPRATGDPLSGAPKGTDPVLTTAYGDIQEAWRARSTRTLILMEHGVGLTFEHPGYAGGLGMRRRVALFLAPNEFIRAKTARSLPLAPQVVIGTPKLDEWGEAPQPASQASPHLAPPFGRRKIGGERPTVCISFHWNGYHISPEAGNAYKHYGPVLSELARQNGFTLIGHGHPKFGQLPEVYERAGIEYVPDFREVMRRADVYVNDCSSTMYEFLVTGKPVVILNAPWFRKNIRHGIRFWEYTDIGPQVEQPEQLLGAIEETLAKPERWGEARERAVRELYPNLGTSAKVAAKALEDFIFWGRVLMQEKMRR